jgi:hypothetical protein
MTRRQAFKRLFNCPLNRLLIFCLRLDLKEVVSEAIFKALPIMAWRCSGDNNVDLITNMQMHGIIHSDRVAAVSTALPLLVCHALG